ncbi:hypothetical protein [Bradyrhizobium sp. URHD0069]|uniref:hypothetical protein n=1 Tax=Bradyrhizobium sp. URHD0069 TaxID=1380355 RepID=UPI00068A9791|nr:hypothetical protein [Bradyrhizobium sp. URHD0069]
MADDEIEDDEEELPPLKTLFLEDGLYRERDLGGDWGYIKRMIVGPDQQFDAHCVYCKQMSTFKEKVMRGSGAGMRPVEDKTYLSDRVFSITTYCQRNEKHSYLYVFEVKRQVLQKIGQSPSVAELAFPLLDNYEPVLERAYLKELKTALGLFAHGVGAGAFVYLRRVFEKLVHDEAEAARKAGEALTGFDDMRLDQKIEALQHRLPPALVKYKLAYGVLSAGVHTLDEATCKRYFPVLQQIIMVILDDHLAARSKRLALEQLDAAFNKVHAEVKTKSKKKPSVP